MTDPGDLDLETTVAHLVILIDEVLDRLTEIRSKADLLNNLAQREDPDGA